MMKRETFAIAKIYVPAKRRATLDPKKAQEIAESILQVGLQTPILVRPDGERFVLIVGYVVQARRH
jgi:sulfiredoxin